MTASLSMLSLAAGGQQFAGSLLKPTGQWPVGRISVEVADSSRAMPDGRSPRRLMVHIWYPANAAVSNNLPYAEGLKTAKGLFTKDELALLERVRTHASAEPPATPSSSGFPVLLFSHGDQTAAFLYSNVNEELASHGYLVVGIDSPGAALFVSYADGTVVPYTDLGRTPDGESKSAETLTEPLRRRIEERAADLRFVLAQLKTLRVMERRLADLISERVGAFGHSSGGLAAVLLGQQQSLIDACLNMDGRLDAAPFVTGAGIPVPSRPFMYFAKPFRHLTDSELQAQGLSRDQGERAREEAVTRDRRLLAASGPPAYRALLHHAEHESFSDEPLLRNVGSSKSAALMQEVRRLTLEFFDATLKHPGKRLLIARKTAYLELEVVASGPPLAEP